MVNGRAEAACHHEIERRRAALRIEERRLRNTECRRRNRELEQNRLWATQSYVTSVEDEDLLQSVSLDRVAALHARRLAFLLAKELGGVSLEYQRVVFERMLDQPLLKLALLESAARRKELQLCKVICNGLREAWSDLKYGSTKDKHMARNVIEASVMSVEDNLCLQAA
jgi:hypothetical protein